MRLLTAILFAILLTGCCSTRPLATTVSTLDSTHTERKVRQRDTLIKLPFYKVEIVKAAGDLTEEPVVKRNGGASVELFKRNDSIYARALCDSLELKLKLQDSIISTYRQVKTDTTITLPPVEVKYIPWYIKALAWIGGIAVLFLAIKFAYNFYKPKFF